MGEKLKTILRYTLHFLCWLLCAVLIGCACGLAGGGFAIAVEWATHTRGQLPWLLYLLPLGGLAIAGLYRVLKLPPHVGTDDVFVAVRSQRKVPVQLAPAIFAATTLTHLLGGSAGREGAALQLGGSIGSAVGSMFRMNGRKNVLRVCELCGMAALFSALFGTPVTAALFVLEVMEVGRINNRALVPCMASAVCASLVAKAIGAPAEVFPLAAGLAQPGGLTLLKAAALGVVFAVMAILFCTVMHVAGSKARKLIPNVFLRAAVGGVLIIGATLLVGCRDYNGGGTHIILEALGGKAKPEAFLLKLLFTALTLSMGFKGGEIVPSFFVGATLGCVAAPLLGLPAALGAGLGMVGVFCGVTNAPIAAMMLSIELFGTEYLLLFGMVAAVSFMLSGRYSLYHSQVFMQLMPGEDEEKEAAQAGGGSAGALL